MKRIENLTMIFALVFCAAAMGCAADPADEPGGDDGASDEPGGGDETRLLDAAGTYRLQSKLDLASSVPGTAGEVVSKIIEITDDPDDPTLWVLDQALAAMPSGYLKSALQSVKPYVAGYLNDRILDLAPDFVPVAFQLAHEFGQMAKGFGLNETLEVSGAPGAYTSNVTVVGAHFTIDGVESDHAFADHGGSDVTAGSAGVTLDAGKLGIGEHRFELSYGKLLRMGLDAAIVPMLEPGATNLNELFASKVSCQLIGQAIAAAVGLGGSSTYASACTAGLNRGASYIYSKIATIDGVALGFGLTGAARAIDKDRDGSVDTINTGAWTGTVSYGSTPAPLAAATFFGARM
jgi:hypothetical protein